MTTVMDRTTIKKRPVHGRSLSNLIRLPKLDSLTVLRGQHLELSFSKLSSTVSHPGMVRVSDNGEVVSRVARKLPLLKLEQKSLTLPTYFKATFQKVPQTRSNRYKAQERSIISPPMVTEEMNLPGPPCVEAENHRLSLVHPAVGTQTNVGNEHLTTHTENTKGLQQEAEAAVCGVNECLGQINSSCPGKISEGSYLKYHTDLIHPRESMMPVTGNDISSKELTGERHAGIKSKKSPKSSPQKYKPKQNVTQLTPARPPQPPLPPPTAHLTPPKSAHISQPSKTLTKSKMKLPTSLLAANKLQKSSKLREKIEYAELLPVSGPEHHLSELDFADRVRSSGKKKKERRERAIFVLDREANDDFCTPPTSFAHSKRGSVGPAAEDSGDANDGVDEKDTEKDGASNDFASVLVPELPVFIETSSSLAWRPRSGLPIPVYASVDAQRNGALPRDLGSEQRRKQLAEQRRRKQQHFYNKLRSKPYQLARNESDPSCGERASFESYEFLAKYCILSQANQDAYRQAFDQVDKQRRGWLSEEQVAIALREVNNKLTGVEKEFLFRIMEMTGYSVADGADFRLFSTLAALSHRISSLDSWMRLMMHEMNMKLLEMKTFLCKSLWEVCVDPSTKRMTLDQLIVELRSGGISHRHEEEVKQKLGHLISLDLLDFLTYSPLFIMIHQSVVENPLSDIRNR